VIKCKYLISTTGSPRSIVLSRFCGLLAVMYSGLVTAQAVRECGASLVVGEAVLASDSDHTPRQLCG
jgi:hypothetical protein